MSYFKLGLYLREDHFDDHYIQRIKGAFVRWGRNTIAQLNAGALRPEDAPEYLLQYYVQHLRELTASIDDFCALLASGWRRSWECFEAGHRGYSRDVTVVYQVLTEFKTEEINLFIPRFHCQLILSSICSIGTQTPWRILVAGVRTGVLTYSDVLHWLEFADTLPRCRALASLVPYVYGERRAEVLAEVTSAIPACAVACASDMFLDQKSLAEIIAAIVAHLSDEQIREVLAQIIGIDDAYVQALAAAALIPKLPPKQKNDVLRLVLERAKGAGKGVTRLSIVGAIAPYLPSDRADDIVLAEAAVAAQWLLSEPYYKVAYAEAYAVLLSRCPPAKKVKPLSNFLSALSGSAKQLTAESIAALVPHFPIELLPEALRLVQSTGEDDDDGYDRIRSLVTLAQYMPAQERRKSLEEALRAARQFEYPYPRVLCFVEIASYLEGEERQKLLAQAQADAEKIGWGDDRADAYARLAEECSR